VCVCNFTYSLISLDLHHLDFFLISI